MIGPSDPECHETNTILHHPRSPFSVLRSPSCPMSTRIATLLESLSSTLNALPGVFSTAQWGGRAYKLPGPGGNRKRPKLVAFIATTRAGDAVTVSFKLERERAADVVERYAWIEPHSFRTLAPSGWVTAVLTTKRQAGTLKKLLAEARTLLPAAEPVEDEPAGPARGRSADPVARRIDRVMRDAAADGWEAPDGEF